MDSLDRIIATKIEDRMAAAEKLVDSGMDLQTLLIMVAELRADHERKLGAIRASMVRLDAERQEMSKRIDDIEPETARPILRALRETAKKDSADIHALYVEMHQKLSAIQAIRFVYARHPDRDKVVSRAVIATDFSREWWHRHAGDNVGKLVEEINKELTELGHA